MKSYEKSSFLNRCEAENHTSSRSLSYFSGQPAQWGMPKESGGGCEWPSGGKRKN